LFGESAELLNVEATGAFSNHLALSIKNADVYEMVRDCNNIDLTMHPIQVHTARVISTTQRWVCYLASFFHSDAMVETPPPGLAHKSRPFNSKRILHSQTDLEALDTVRYQ
jgi:hypothetical protein